MADFQLNLAQVPTLLPSALPPCLLVDGERLVDATSWKHQIARAIIPGYAKASDAEATRYFLRFFKNVIGERQIVSAAQLRTIIRLAEEHLSQRAGCDPRCVPKEVADLQRYTLAARIRINDFQSSEEEHRLRQTVYRSNQALAIKWRMQGFSARAEDEEAFWAHPDLVDFIFKLHLHRHIRHQDYQHHIEMHPRLKQREGVWTVETEAHLKMNDRMVAWSQIRSLIQIEEATRRMYSVQPDGKKQYWMYLDRGFVQQDRHDMERMGRFKKLDIPPARSRVEVITSHDNRKKWNFADRLLQGARHTFFRIVIGEGFHARHPDLPYQDGEVYSIGWGGTWVHFNPLQPLTALQGQWYCPDSSEFFAEDLYVTQKDVQEENIVRLFELVKQKAQQNNSFQILVSNCCTHSIGVLREAEILDIETKDHFLTMVYEFLFPERIRNCLNQIGSFFFRHTPAMIRKGGHKLLLFLYSLILSPLFLLLGAWRTKVTYEQESNPPGGMTLEEGMLRSRNRIKALFSTIYDLFDPDKVSFDLTLKVWRWQKQYAEQHPERTFFIQKT